MSMHAFPRDNGDDEPVDERPRGRAVPRAIEEPSPLLIDIRVNGVTFGTIDPLRLKARAQMDLERAYQSATPVTNALAWCRDYGGVSDTLGPMGQPSELAQLTEELAEMPVSAVLEFIVGIQQALGEAMSIPKTRGRR